MKSIYETVMLKLILYLGIPIFFAYGIVFTLNFLFGKIFLVLLAIFCALCFILSLLYANISNYYINLRITKKPVLFIIIFHGLYIVLWFFLPYTLLLSIDLNSAKNAVVLIIVIVFFGIMVGTLFGFLLANDYRLKIQDQNQTQTIIQQPELKQEQIQITIVEDSKQNFIKSPRKAIFWNEMKKFFQLKNYPPRMRILSILVWSLLLLVLIWIIFREMKIDSPLFTRIIFSFGMIVVLYFGTYIFFYSKPQYGDTVDHYGFIGSKAKLIGLSPRMQKYSAFIYGGTIITVYCMSFMAFLGIWIPDIYENKTLFYVMLVMIGIISFFSFNAMLVNLYQMFKFNPEYRSIEVNSKKTDENL